MEEWVGKQWDRFIRRAASRQHEAAAVALPEVQRAITLMFRAAGGAPADTGEEANCDGDSDAVTGAAPAATAVTRSDAERAA